MRALLFGYREFGCVGFEALVRHGFRVASVVTHRDDPHEARFWPSLADAARAAGVSVATPASARDPDVEALVAAAEPDFIFSFYYRELIPARVLAHARRGALNLHGSLLPRLRGCAPVNWALVHGETETGVSLHHMVARPDAGDLVDQEPVAIEPSDTAYTLTRRLVPAAARLLDRALPLLVEGRAARVPQDLAAGSYVPRRRPEDGRFSWSWPARRIHHLVRAVTHPYPGAFVSFGSRRLTVWWAVPIDARADAAPGTVLDIHAQGADVATGDGVLRLVMIQFDGEPESPAAALANWSIQPGDRLVGDPS